MCVAAGSSRRLGRAAEANAGWVDSTPVAEKDNSQSFASLMGKQVADLNESTPEVGDSEKAEALRKQQPDMLAAEEAKKTFWKARKKKNPGKGDEEEEKQPPKKASWRDKFPRTGEQRMADVNSVRQFPSLGARAVAGGGAPTHNVAAPRCTSRWPHDRLACSGDISRPLHPHTIVHTAAQAGPGHNMPKPQAQGGIAPSKNCWGVLAAVSSSS